MNKKDLSQETIKMLDDIYKLYGPVKCAALRKDYKIYTGRSHSECFSQEPKGVLVDAEQGFVTKNKMFVTREMAYLLADWFNQINVKHPPENQLFSEDLKEIDVIKI